MNTLIELTAPNHRAVISERTERRSYPNCPYLVDFIRLTPKGKWQKDKVLKRYVYTTLENAKQSAENWINTIAANLQRREEEKRKKREANKAISAADFYKVGDIVLNTWGWEQTNVEFYEVVEVKDRTIRVQRIGSKIEEGSMMSHGMACHVLPDTESREDEFYNLLVKSGWNGEGHSLSNPQSYYYFHKWDGRASYQSWYA